MVDDGAPGSAGSQQRSGRAEPVPGVRPPVRPRGRARAQYVGARVHGVLRSRWDILAVIAAGGAIGSLARWGLTQLIHHPAGTFPWATFTANTSGCLLLGALMVFVLDLWPPSRYARPFLGVGVLGGFTTFSTYMLDSRALLVSGRTALAGEYVFGSLFAGLVAVWLGATGARLAVRSVSRVSGRRPEPVQQQGVPSLAGPSAANPGAANPSAANPGAANQSIPSTRSTP